jgi:hypothetical protein
LYHRVWIRVTFDLCRRLVSLTLAVAVAVSLTARTPGQTAFLSYADVRSILAALNDIVPAELKTGDDAHLEAAWNAWVAQHDREIRQRLARGDDDTIVNWLFFGTTFTSQPRVALTSATAADQGLMPLVTARAHDLAAALASPGRDERRLFARRIVERHGLRLTTDAERVGVQEFLVAEVRRVLGEWRQYAKEIETSRTAGDASQDFAARSKLFRDRGLSLDTTIQPGFALEQALREMKAKGLVKARGIRRVAVIGPGLDFSDKGAGYDFYPQQTLQPFALIDSLRRLDLVDPDASGPLLTTLDISPRVNDHLRRARLAAGSGTPYRLHLPLDASVSWTADLVDYWQRAGSEIGTVAAERPPAPFGQAVRIRTVTVPAPAVLLVTPEDLDIVTQRLAGQPFDLMVATNVFVYYDTLEQSLALANVEAMLAPGGFLLSNNALLELPSSRVHSVGYLTVPYSDRTDDGDHIVFYRRQ